MAGGFDDHTVARLTSAEEFDAVSRQGVAGERVVKFAIPDLGQPGVHWLDSGFYEFHDEWYWFRLLNGQVVPNAPATPETGRRFATIDEIETWAAAQSGPLLLGLRIIDRVTSGSRLYAPDFYRLVLNGSPRTWIVGSLVHHPASDAAAGGAAPGNSTRAGGASTGTSGRWLIELEFSDTPTPADLDRTFDRLGATLPASVRAELAWVVRSPAQEDLARWIQAADLPRHDQIVRYHEFAPTGAAAVYSPGVTAGLLRFVGKDGASIGDVADGDIVVTDFVPDHLPPARAIITSAPQTALSHVALLARSRGIPDVSIAGIHLDPGVRQAARVRAPAAIVAEPGGSVRLVLLTREQYESWAATSQPTPNAVPAVDPASVEVVVDLTSLARAATSEADFERWRPLLGGKSVGFLALLATPGLDPPPDPLAITVAPYLRHLAPLRPRITALLTDPDVIADPRARWVALEGLDDFAATFPDERDGEYRDEFVARHPPGTPLGALIAAGGLREVIEDAPVDPGDLAPIEAALRRNFSRYTPTTGLRFRSSSSVEDIEGFTGAGLYQSFTGYLDAAAQSDADERRQSIGWAIAHTWASYWSFEAFEERRLAAIDHLSGAMGITVHARFDDDLEANNGVATWTFRRGGAPTDADIEINVQRGSTAVTNPDGTATPEVITIERRSGRVTIRRPSPSSLSSASPVLDDTAVTELVGQLDVIAGRWRERVNAGLPRQRRAVTVTLDIEFKTVKAGWPATRSGKPWPARLVVRQVRSLDPGLGGLPATLRELPVPTDVLARATRIDEVRCPPNDPTVTPTGTLSVTPTVSNADAGANASMTGAGVGYEVWTNPLAPPDMGFSTVPWRTGPPARSDCRRLELFAAPDQQLRQWVLDGAPLVEGRA